MTTRMGQNLSLGWLAMTSAQDTYSEFKQAGASDAVAGIGMLASIAALYELMNMNYFRDQLFKGTFMDETEAKDVVKNWAAEESARMDQAFKITPKGDRVAAVGRFNRMKEKAKDWWQRRISGKAISGQKQPLQGAEEAAGGTTKSKAWNNFQRMLNRSVNEGIEETMEEVSTDMIKALSEGAEALGIPVAEESGTKLDFGFSPEEIFSRYTATFFGGALGGATFEGMDIWEKYIGPKVVDMFDLTTKKQLTYLIATGHAGELRDRAKLMYDRGLLGNKNLSAKEKVTRTTPDGKTEVVYAAGTETDNQNLYMYNALVNQIRYMENIIFNHGLSKLFMFQFTPDGKIAVDSEGNPIINSDYRAALEKERAVEKDQKISSEEYLFRYKTNALLEMVSKYKMDSTYMTDVLNLTTKIVDAQSKLDDILNSKAPATTDAGKRLQLMRLPNQKMLSSGRIELNNCMLKETD